MAIVQPLKKPVLRRVGNVIFRLALGGVSVRGHGKKKWQSASLVDVVKLCQEVDPAEGLEAELQTGPDSNGGPKHGD